MGVLEVPRRILATEEYSSDQSDNIISKNISEIGEATGSPIGEQAYAYLKDIEQLKTYTEILNRDSSGFQLVEKIVTDVAQGLEKNPDSMFVREFMTKGTEAGALI